MRDNEAWVEALNNPVRQQYERVLNGDERVEVVQYQNGEWRLFIGAVLHPATWESKEAAQAYGRRCIEAKHVLP